MSSSRSRSYSGSCTDRSVIAGIVFAEWMVTVELPLGDMRLISPVESQTNRAMRRAGRASTRRSIGRIRVGQNICEKPLTPARTELIQVLSLRYIRTGPGSRCANTPEFEPGYVMFVVAKWPGFAKPLWHFLRTNAGDDMIRTED